MVDQERPPLLEKLFEGDSYLRNFESDILLRWKRMKKIESSISTSEGSLAAFAKSYKQCGIVQMKSGDVEVG